MNWQFKQNNTNKEIVKPVVFNNLNLRCQIDLIDMQTKPNGQYKFIFAYQNYLTKFVKLGKK